MTLLEQALVAGLVLGAAVIGIAFFHGRRRNRAIAVRTAREIESALEPLDTTYTWIGGLIGFHARYEVAGLEKARATCTLLPRHALLYLPLSLLMGRGDRAHVTLYLETDFEGEAHVISAAHLRSPLVHIEGRERMQERAREEGGTRFVLLATDPRLMDGMMRLLDRIRETGHVRSIRHLAFVPDLSTLYAQVVPADGVVEELTRLLMDDGRRLVSR